MTMAAVTRTGGAVTGPSASLRGGQLRAKLQRRLAQGLARAGWYPAFTIAAGPASGLRIRLENASGDYVLGTNELPVQRAVVQRLLSGSVFYDIGSNIGFFALLGARAVGPTGHVYAFEPVPNNAKCIESNARSNRFTNITVVSEAVGAESGTAELLLTPHPGGATLSRPDAGEEVTGSLRVPMVSVDDLVGSDRVRPPDLVKIDVEGTEAEVLAGMEKTMAEHTPVLVVEVDDSDRDIAERKYQALREQVEAAGYRVERLEPAYRGMDWAVLHFVAVPVTQ